MELADRISEMVRPTVEGLGYSLVRVQVWADNGCACK